MTDQPEGAIAVDASVLGTRSAEIARVWITDGAGSTVWIDARILEDPHLFGHLIANTVRHAARAYAGTWDMPEDTALQAIVDGLTAQLREQATDLTTIQDGSLN
jgi:hypothetical protein